MRIRHVGIPVIFATSALFATMSLAGKVEIECPEEIKTKQSAAAVKGWEVYADTITSRQIFTGIALFEGPPKDGLLLMAEPPASDSAEKAQTDVYKVSKNRDTYVSCQYTGTLVRLNKKLPKDLQTCQVRFLETLGHVQKAVCE